MLDPRKSRCTDSPLRVLLISHNTARVFEDLPTRLPLFLDRLNALVQRHGNPDVIALHMQEVAGSKFKSGGGLEVVTEFAAGVHAHFPQYWTSGLLCEVTKGAVGFSALGSIYLVHGNVAHRVEVWQNLGDDPNGASACYRAVGELPSPLVPSPRADPRYCLHAQLPAALFEDGKLSRKGMMLTTWRLDGVSIDLLNVHNVHDESNLVALQSTLDGAPSAYATRRGLCLAHMLTEREHHLAQRRESFSGADTVAPCALFVFGDFNFRLSLSGVVESLCGRAGLERAREWVSTQDMGAASESATRVIDERTKAKASGAVEARSELELALPAAAAAHAAAAHEAAAHEAAAHEAAAHEAAGSPAIALRLSKKLFRLGQPGVLIEERERFLAFDAELDAFAAAAPNGMRLTELPIDFPPTYTYDDAPEADGAGGSSSGAASGKASLPMVAHSGGSRGLALAMASSLSPKRCPAWCDRVLMDPHARAIVERSPSAATYGSELQPPPDIITDHNAVYLTFELSRSS